MIAQMSANEQQQSSEDTQGNNRQDDSNDTMNLNNASAAALFRAAQNQQQQLGNNRFQMAQNPFAAAMFQQAGPAPATNGDQQQQPASNVDLSNELKRLQQLQQLANAQPSLLMPRSQQHSNDNPAAFLQSMIDHKVQVPRLENPFGQSFGAGNINQMLQPAFLQDARLLMVQNQLNAALNPMQQGRSEMPLPSPHSLFHRDGSRRMRGGVIEPFPEKLHRLLLEVEAAGRSDVISFVANGQAFSIHKPDKFFKEIVPLYFRQSRLSSFKRQLNLYGFELINTGPARGGYFHELFVKDRPELCRRMRRVAVKVVPKSDGASKDNESEGTHTDEHEGGEKELKNAAEIGDSKVEGSANVEGAVKSEE